MGSPQVSFGFFPKDFSLWIFPEGFSFGIVLQDIFLSICLGKVLRRVSEGVPWRVHRCSLGLFPKDFPWRDFPLELFYKMDNEPTYGITSDDENRALDTQKLPFQAFGALGMARGNDDVDSGSADWFFLKWTQPLVPPGRNTLDGYYSCFGYIVSDNQDLLKQMGKGDKIVSARVISGIDNLQK